MDFNRGDLHRLESVKESDGCVGVCTRIDDDAVDLLEICLLDVIDQIALMIALEALDLYPLALAVGCDHGDQVIVSGSTVDIRLPDAEHVEVRSVKHKYFHSLFQLSQDIGDRLVVEILLNFESVIGDLVVAPGLVLVLALLIELLNTVEL